VKSRIILAFILVMGLISFPVASMAGPNGDTEIFKVWVKEENGEKFPDCYRFGSDGILTIDELGFPLVWDYNKLGTSKFRWQSTSTDESPFGIAFSGIKFWLGVSGDAINDGGETFTFKGKRVKECSVNDGANAAAGGNHYLP